MISEVPAELYYTRGHEWVRAAPDGMLTVGITDHAQRALGDLVYVEPPEIGQRFAAGEPCAVAESVKAASDVYSPVAGTVWAVNTKLVAAPERVNEDPYGEGWLWQLQPDSTADIGALLDAVAYTRLITGGEG